jgi:ABC-2 type transport system ATP-binding protein
VQAGSVEPIIDQPLIKLSSVSAGYGPLDVVREVNMEVRCGEIFVLLGPNAAGKSSLLRVLTGRLETRTGKILNANGTEVRPNVELIPQETALYPFMTVRENCVALAMMTGLTRDLAGRRATEVLNSIGCSAIFDIRVDRLSGGYKRRVDIAVSLMKSPAMLALDEPSAGLDAVGREALIGLLMQLRAAGTGSIVVTHDFEFGEAVADRIGLLVRGSLIVDATLEEAVEYAFASEKLVEVDLAAQPDLRQRRSLESAGLTQSSGNLWTMHARMETNPIDRLAAILKELRLTGREIRIRSPSLRDVYRKHVQERTDP